MDRPARSPASTARTTRLAALLPPLLLGAGLAGAADLHATGRVPPPAEAHYDDLLTDGLGLGGLRGPIPALADAAAPTFDELRRRALWANWRGIADVAPGGGLGEVYGDLTPVPGREFHHEATLPGARHPHRMLLQLPDHFDAAQPCLVVAASSGSRGIYGAIALAGSWGLPRGCAVAYTDKAAGTDWQRGGDSDTVFVPHSHSGDHPEADWGRHLLQAAAFGARVIEQETGVPPTRLTVLLAGLSNGAGAVLRAAGDITDPALELGRDADGTPWRLPALAGAMALAPNIHVDGARPLYDVATEASLALPHDPEQLRATGWTDEALAAAGLSTQFDMWRAVAAGYASSYLRRGPEDMPAGYRYAARDAEGRPAAPTPAEAALWWSDSSGIPPGNGVVLLDPEGENGRQAGLEALRALWTGDGEEAKALRAAVAQTAVRPPDPTLPILLVHGLDDGLVLEAFNSAPYADFARRHGSKLGYWRLRHVQHFDAFLGLPALATRYLPLLPYGHAALDALLAHVLEDTPLPPSRVIEPRQRRIGTAGVTPLAADDLGL